MATKTKAKGWTNPERLRYRRALDLYLYPDDEHYEDCPDWDAKALLDFCGGIPDPWRPSTAQAKPKTFELKTWSISDLEAAIETPRGRLRTANLRDFRSLAERVIWMCRQGIPVPEMVGRLAAVGLTVSEEHVHKIKADLLARIRSTEGD